MQRPPQRKIQDARINSDASLNQVEKANIRSKQWFKDNKARRYAYIKKWNKRNKAKISVYQKSHKMKLRKIVIGYYSAYRYRCACCFETHIEFLTIDHIEGGGSKQRRELGRMGGHNFYIWLKNSNFPIGYRVLCMNCNHALGHWGYCPHNKSESTTMPL